MDTFHRGKQNLSMPGPSGTSTCCSCLGRAVALERRLKSCGLCQCQGPALALVQHEWWEKQLWERSHQSEITQGCGSIPLLRPTRRGWGSALPSTAHSAQDPKRKIPVVTEDDEVCLTRTQPIL